MKYFQTFRQFLSICIFALLPAHALQAEPICDGKYALAEEMLDAAYGQYGTLYSGGVHFNQLSDVGATIDLYRLWRGLPDLAFRDIRRSNLRWEFALIQKYRTHGRQWAGMALSDNLAIITGPDQIDLPDTLKLEIAIAADLATTVGPSPDWWLDPTILADLGSGERLTYEMAQQEPFVDWLQTTLAVSAAPWAGIWYMRPPVYTQDPAIDRLLQNAFKNYETENGLEWGVAISLFGVPENKVAEKFRNDLKQLVDDCTASQAEFAAYVVARFGQIRRGGELSESDRDLMPQSMRVTIFQNVAMRFIHGKYTSRYRDRYTEIPAYLTNLVDDIRIHAWFNVAHTYAAASIEQLITIHANLPLDQRVVRALNVLSADDLIFFARDQGRLREDRLIILRAAFARLIALDRLDEAEALIPDLRVGFPEDSAKLEAIIAGNWPLDARLSLLVLNLPETSVWITEGTWSFTSDIGIWLRARSKRGLDLPSELRTAAFLQRDLEAWLRMPRRLKRYRQNWGNIGGYNGAVARRVYRRGVTFTWYGRIPDFFPAQPGGTPFGFLDLIAWQEISRLGSRHGLSRHVSLALIEWADTGTDNWFKRQFAPMEEMAEALRSVILLQQSNDTGEYNDQPIGQIAFALLHNRFPETAAAKATQYWYVCLNHCER